jgi:hypothetical protein
MDTEPTFWEKIDQKSNRLPKEDLDLSTDKSESRLAYNLAYNNGNWECEKHKKIDSVIRIYAQKIKGR